MGCNGSKVSAEEVKYTIQLEGRMDTQGGGHGNILQCFVNPGHIAAIAKKIDPRLQEGIAYPELSKTKLANYIPRYFGNHMIDGAEYLVIENLTKGMSSPCMTDLKVGTRHYDLDATEEKKNGLLEKAKDSTTPSLGFRLIDGKIRKNKTVEHQWDRKQGLRFTTEELKNFVDTFFPTKNLKEKVLTQLRSFIKAYQDTLQEYPGFRIYASSLLIAYDGDGDLNQVDPRLKLIDFAHYYLDISKKNADPKDHEYDDGVIKGCISFQSMLE